ncbi:hypothetical protein CFP56_011489 [Quercus suber]|uniref:Uncharacterized protein n=1 Tax=Quercus suber TaxID=58331 RepID=A0AAW0M3N4_QUESU
MQRMTKIPLRAWILWLIGYLSTSVNCNFVQWIDGEICTRAKQSITGLIRKANKLEAKILQLEKAN